MFKGLTLLTTACGVEGILMAELLLQFRSERKTKILGLPAAVIGCFGFTLQIYFELPCTTIAKIVIFILILEEDIR